MIRYGKSVFCAAALLLMTSGWARGAEAARFAADEPYEESAEQFEFESRSTCDGCGDSSCCCCDKVPACGGSPFAVFVPDLQPGIQFSGSVLVLRPGADNLGWATITTFLPVQNPQWAVQDINPAYQAGFGVGARYVFPSSGRDIQANYEHLRTSDSAYVAVDDLDTQWITPFSQTGPSTSENANQVGLFHFKSASADLGFDYDMATIDAGQWVNFGQCTQVRVFAGLSWARLREQLVTNFYNDPNVSPVPPVVAPPNPDLEFIQLNNTSTFTGVGPRLGFALNQNVTRRLTVVGQLSGALLAGTLQPAQYVFQGVYDDNDDREQISSRRVSQLVYATDAKLGFGYNCGLGNCSTLSLEGGFKAALFLNSFATYETSTNVLPLDIGSLSTNSMRHTPSNFTLTGWYATASLLW